MIDSDTDTLLRDKGFEFSGTITGGVSHEINNVFATINELVGLVDDLCHVAGVSGRVDPDRVARITGRVVHQINRGQEYVQRLNRFAHSADKTSVTIGVNDELDAFVFLSRRYATLRSVTIRTDLPPRSPRVVGCPFELSHLWYRCLELMLSCCVAGDELTVTIEPREEGFGMVWSGRVAAEAPEGLDDRVAFLRVLVEHLRGDLDEAPDRSGGRRLALTLPARLR